MDTSGMTMAQMFAARVAAAGKVNLAVAPDPIIEVPQEKLKESPNLVRFIGPSGASLWFGGQKSGKRFSVNGEYLTDRQEEIRELRKMSGVTELKPMIPLSGDK